MEDAKRASEAADATRAAEARTQAQLCLEVESELRELSQECRKKFPIIKEYTERAIIKIRHHKDAMESSIRISGTLPEFPLDEVLRAILMACETFQHKIVMVSLSCLQRLIHREVLKDETIAIVINLMKEQATNGDEIVQLKVLQTIMATPSHMTLLNELVVEQLMQLLYVLHNSPSASVHHTACAGLRQLAEHLTDRAAAAAEATACAAPDLGGIRPVIRRSSAALPCVTPAQAPQTLTGPLRMFYVFVQDLCVMADYDASSLSTRYSLDAGERMRTGHREGYWLAAVKFPRPLCLELLAACVSTHPSIFTCIPECFALLRHNVCATLLKNLRGCFDFAILIRSIHLLQKVFKSPALAAALMPELQVFLHLMLDLTTAERSSWQRATSLEFLKSICEDPVALAVLYDNGLRAQATGTGSPNGSADPRTFLELVNSLSKLIHQVCFSSGMDSSILLQSAASSGATTASAISQRSDSRGILQGGANLLDRAGLLSNFSLPHFGSVGGRDIFGVSAVMDGVGGSSQMGRRDIPARMKLLLLMSETDPPAIQPPFLVSLVVESVFAIVSTMYRLLLDVDEGAPAEHDASTASREEALVRASAPDGPSPGRVAPLAEGQVSASQERCRGMLADCWASLLSALSLLLHGTTDETGLQQALRCLQTLLYCCGRLSLEQARDACLLQLARYAVPVPGQAESEPGGGGGYPSGFSSSSGFFIPTSKSVLCFKALLHFCYRFGGLLGESGWTIALRAFHSLERSLQKAPVSQGNELTLLRQALDSLFETTSLLSDAALVHVVAALGRNLRSTTDAEEGAVVLNRMVELCNFNLGRLFVVWEHILAVITEVCGTRDEKQELRGLGASALCRILAQALRKGALAMAEHPEAAQDELLRHLEVLLRAPHEDTRARICEGLLGILQASGQELHPTAWSTMIHLVSTAARVELERVGLVFYLPGDAKLLKKQSNTNGADHALDCSDVTGEGVLPPSYGISTPGGGGSTAFEKSPENREVSSAAPTVFQLLELLVHDFMEYVPPESVPMLTASIGAFARFTGLGVNSSLTAVGFLWNVADALARYHCTVPPASDGESREKIDGSGPSPEALAHRALFEELWVQIFMQLRALAVDARPEVRNCAVKSLSTALLSHGRKVGTACYQRCLADVLIKVVAEIQTKPARSLPKGATGSKSDGLIVHHSRDTPEKQWDETLVLAMEGVRRVLSRFSEEAGTAAFAPLAYTMLLQIQETIRALSAETAGSALRALVDLMRIPASSQTFEVNGGFVTDPALPIGASSTSIWLLGWSVLWSMVNFCRTRELPESLVETFSSTLNALRSSHRHCFTPAQHLVLVQLSMVLVTAPLFFLPSSIPLQAVGETQGGAESLSTSAARLAAVARSCAEEGAQSDEDRAVFRFLEASPETLWNLELRSSGGQKLGAYSKAPEAVKLLVSGNQSRNLEVWSTEAALQIMQGSDRGKEDASQAFLGPSRSPTHRTMLHISSARLQHVQGFAFGLLEETQGFPEFPLEVLFLCQVCAMFLDARRVLVDTNKLALAARALCLVVLFCRRVLFEQLSKLDGAGAAGAEAKDSGTGSSGGEATRRLEALLGDAVPGLCQAITELACCKGRPKLRESGIWKLAVEALVYVVEDTMVAAKRCTLSPEACSRYWDAVVSSLEEVVSTALQSGGPHDAAAEDSSLLAQVVGNLISQRLLACSETPPAVSEKAVHWLKALVSRESAQSGGEANLRHLFVLCARPEEPSALAEKSIASSGEEGAKLSVASLSARGGRAALHHPNREPLLGVAVPALVSHVKVLFDSYVQEQGSVARRSQVRFVLSHLKELHADAAAISMLSPASERAKTACRLAGPRGLIMALLPQLGGLCAVGDEDIRREVRDLLQALSGELGL